MGRVVSPLLSKWDWTLIHVLIADNSKQSSHIPVFIRILDINDHAPEFAMYYETFVCENAKPGQVNKIILNFKNDIFSSQRWMTLPYFTCTCILFFMQTVVNLLCYYLPLPQNSQWSKQDYLNMVFIMESMLKQEKYNICFNICNSPRWIHDYVDTKF